MTIELYTPFEAYLSDEGVLALGEGNILLLTNVYTGETVIVSNISIKTDDTCIYGCTGMVGGDIAGYYVHQRDTHRLTVIPAFSHIGSITGTKVEGQVIDDTTGLLHSEVTLFGAEDNVVFNLETDPRTFPRVVLDTSVLTEYGTLVQLRHAAIALAAKAQVEEALPEPTVPVTAKQVLH